MTRQISLTPNALIINRIGQKFLSSTIGLLCLTFCPISFMGILCPITLEKYISFIFLLYHLLFFINSIFSCPFMSNHVMFYLVLPMYQMHPLLLVEKSTMYTSYILSQVACVFVDFEHLCCGL